MRHRCCASCGSPQRIEVYSRREDAYFEVDPTLEDYMVHDEVWERAGMGKQGFLHLRCLESRLRRRLTLADFTNYPVNNGIRFGFQLGKTEYGEELGRHILELANTTGLEPVFKEDP